MSVLLELQADCFAGIWAHNSDKFRSLLEPGDAEEGLTAAAAIGDDHLLHRAGRTVRPDSFTHGSSEQHTFWLRKVLESGDVANCNTFSPLAKKKSEFDLKFLGLLNATTGIECSPFY